MRAKISLFEMVGRAPTAGVGDRATVFFDGVCVVQFQHKPRVSGKRELVSHLKWLEQGWEGEPIWWSLCFDAQFVLQFHHKP